LDSGRISDHRTAEDEPTRQSDAIDYLLSAGRLSGTQRDRIEGSILDGVRRQQRLGRLRRTLGVLGGLAAGATVLVLVLLRGAADGQVFREKGSREAAARPLLDMGCLEAALDACPAGSTLGFSARTDGEKMFVTAFAEAAGSVADGSRIWYLFNEPLPSPAHGADVVGTTRVIGKGAKVGGDHQHGRYRVTLLLTRRPLSRTEAALHAPAGDVVAARAERDLVVVARP
jgi:hypothetical protein